MWKSRTIAGRLGTFLQSVNNESRKEASGFTGLCRCSCLVWRIRPSSCPRVHDGGFIKGQQGPAQLVSQVHELSPSRPREVAAATHKPWLLRARGGLSRDMRAPGSLWEGVTGVSWCLRARGQASGGPRGRQRSRVTGSRRGPPESRMRAAWLSFAGEEGGV